MTPLPVHRSTVRPTAVILGGMEWNVPDGLRQLFRIVGHIEQRRKPNSIPQTEYVLVIRDFVGHAAIQAAKSLTNARFVFLPRGWAAMSKELERVGIL